VSRDLWWSLYLGNVEVDWSLGCVGHVVDRFSYALGRSS